MGKRLGKSEGQVPVRLYIFTLAFDGNQMRGCGGTTVHNGRFFQTRAQKHRAAQGCAAWKGSAGVDWKRMGKRLGKSEGQVQGRSQIFTPAFDGRRMCDTGHKRTCKKMGRRMGAPRERDSRELIGDRTKNRGVLPTFVWREVYIMPQVLPQSGEWMQNGKAGVEARGGARVRRVEGVRGS